jgi:hypothetical protein
MFAFRSAKVCSPTYFRGAKADYPAGQAEKLDCFTDLTGATIHGMDPARVNPATIVLLSIALFAIPRPSYADEVEFFETRIRPVLVKHCYECHSSASAEIQGGLVVDYREGLRKGGETGPAVLPGMPEKSLLLDALRYEALEMPPAGKLPPQVIADFERWIRGGAHDPRDHPPTAEEAAALAWATQLAERRQWWSLQAPVVTDLPAVNQQGWATDPVDRFVLAKLEDVKLLPAPPADAATLLRRLSFVLTGLPPTPSEVQVFQRELEVAPEAALESVVDRLMASPRFGERFARHWMDVVRYTDTYGYEWDNPAKGSWEYRDYLIRAFNEDVGFDQLIREQLAGDLLEVPRVDRARRWNESLIGPMFFHLGEHRHGNSLEFNGVHQEMVNNKVDAFSKTFLAMTVACARCHDHKLDAISQADYYALAGVFMSPRWTSRVIDAPGRYDGTIAELRRLRADIQSSLVELWRPDGLELEAALRDWAKRNQETVPAVGDVALPILKLMALGAEDDTVFAANWDKLSAEWRALQMQLRAANAEKFTLLTDFQVPGFPQGWIPEGAGIESGYVTDGVPLVSLTGDSLVAELLARGYHTHALSSQLPGAIRLPDQGAIPQRNASLQLRGGQWAGYLVSAQNAFQSEVVKFLQPQTKTPQTKTPQTKTPWITLADQPLKNGVTRILSEVVTSQLNPNFPPRTGLATVAGTTLPHTDMGLEHRSWFSVTKIVTHDAGGIPGNTLEVYNELLLNGTSPQNAAEGWTRLANWFHAALTRWGRGEATSADVLLVNWLLQQELLPNKVVDAPQIAELVELYRRQEAQIEFPRTANSMEERGVSPVDYRLNIRGDVDREGAVIGRRFLEVFAVPEVAASRGSGRLELANYFASGRNPQAARVYVNRIWHWVFGAGIVATPSDFGKLGGRPSHPELLDWLAIRFVEDGWSTKRLIRSLVLSQTFRQSGQVHGNALEVDPANRLLHHYPTRRLEAEAIRDSLLAAAGRLDTQLFGPPINPPRHVEDPSKRLFSGPLDSNGRRSIYMQMSIMDPPKFLVGFNLPDLKLPTGRRDVTNVPAQALALLNDPLVVELAAQWGKLVVADNAKTPAERVHGMFVRVTGRAPLDRELDRWTQAVISFSQAEEGTGQQDVMQDEDAWANLAHVFFNMKEFIYYR